MADQQTLTVKGIVQAVEVTGSGPSSAELVAVVNGKAMRAGAFPATEPSVFSAFVTLLTAAFYAKRQVEVTFLPAQDGLPQIVGIVCI